MVEKSDVQFGRRSVGVKDVEFGSEVTVVEPVNLCGCEIGDECFVGPFVEIQRNVKIGARTKIQSHSFICELVEIGSDCFIGHGVMFVNDTFSKGSNATLLPVNICDDVVIGAGAVVTRNIDVPGVYAGNPARKREN